jgi:hypothetical protein
VIEELPEDWESHVMASALATTYTIELTGSGPHLEAYAHEHPILVRRFSNGRWWINVDRVYTLGGNGKLDYTPLNSDIDDEWIECCTFTLESALHRANKLAVERYPEFVDGANRRERIQAERSRKAG